VGTVTVHSDLLKTKIARIKASTARRAHSKETFRTKKAGEKPRRSERKIGGQNPNQAIYLRTSADEGGGRKE